MKLRRLARFAARTARLAWVGAESLIIPLFEAGYSNAAIAKRLGVLQALVDLVVANYKRETDWREHWDDDVAAERERKRGR